MFHKSTILVALVVVPLCYAVVRLLPQPGPLWTSGLLHWGFALLVLRVSKTAESPDIGLRHRRSRFLVFVVLIAGYCCGLNWLFDSQTLAEWQRAQMPFGRWGVVVTAMTAGFCEEIIFRGYMMTGLKHAGLPAWLAMILSSLSFVYFHGAPPVPLAVAFFVLTMIWAAIYHQTSVLWVTIYIHAFWDATVLLMPFESTP